MKNAIKILALTSLLTGTALAHDGNNGWVTAKDYTLWSSTNGTDVIRLQVKDGVYNPAGHCTDPDSYMVGRSLTKEAQQRIYSTLLSAKIAGHPVRLQLDTNNCEWSRPKILNVTI